MTTTPNTARPARRPRASAQPAPVAPTTVDAPDGTPVPIIRPVDMIVAPVTVDRTAMVARVVPTMGVARFTTADAPTAHHGFGRGYVRDIVSDRGADVPCVCRSCGDTNPQHFPTIHRPAGGGRVRSTTECRKCRDARTSAARAEKAAIADAATKAPKRARKVTADKTA